MTQLLYQIDQMLLKMA